MNTIWTEKDVENITQWTIRTLWNFGVRPGDIVQNGFSYGLWVAGMSCHYAAKAIGCFVLPIGASMAERQVDYLVIQAPLYCYLPPPLPFILLKG